MIYIPAIVWSELSSQKTSMSYSPEGYPKTQHELHPRDLHNYTGSKDPIPEGGFHAGSVSYNWPDEEDTNN
jgi:hypothetical protein